MTWPFLWGINPIWRVVLEALSLELALGTHPETSKALPGFLELCPRPVQELPYVAGTPCPSHGDLSAGMCTLPDPKIGSGVVHHDIKRMGGSRPQWKDMERIRVGTEWPGEQWHPNRGGWRGPDLKREV